MFDIFNTVEFYSYNMGIDECAQRHGQRGVEIGCRGVESRDKAYQISHQDKNKKSGNKREKEFSFWSGDFHHEIFKATYHDFKKILPLLGKQLETPGEHYGADYQD
jgi:hypothetical protein